MADLKYASEGRTLVVTSKKDEKVSRSFDVGRFGEATQKRLADHGFKVLIQQRTSQLRGKASDEEVLQAMSEVFEDLLSGNWNAARKASSEGRKFKVATALARALLTLGKAKGAEIGVIKKLMEKKLEELDAIAEHPGIAEEYRRALDALGEEEEIEVTL